MVSAKEKEDGGFRKNLLPIKELGCIACAVVSACTLTLASPVISANQRLPPLSTEPYQCEKALVDNTIGQANGVYDKPLDLRLCDYTNDQTNLKGKTLSAALMSGARLDVLHVDWVNLNNRETLTVVWTGFAEEEG